jgi:hypothetical protein
MRNFSLSLIALAIKADTLSFKKAHRHDPCYEQLLCTIAHPIGLH